MLGCFLTLVGWGAKVRGVETKKNLRWWPIIAFLGYLGLAVVFTWPTVAHMGTHMPGGAGDPSLSCWYLARDMDRFMSFDLRHFYDANLFYPQRNTAAYSEHFAGVALLALPLRPLFGGNIVAVYNAIMLLCMALTALGMHLLVRELGGRHVGAVAAALIVTFAPCRIGQIEHLHMLMAQWVPFSLLYLVRFLRGARRRDAAAFTFFFLLNAVSTILYLIFLTCACLLVAGVELIARRSLRGLVVPTLCMGVVITAVLAAIYLPYFEVRSELGLSRNMKDNLTYSAIPSAYLAPPAWQGNHLVARRWLHLDRFAYPEGALLQGFVAYGGALAALILLLRRRVQLKPHHVWAVALVGFGVLISFGPVFQFAGGHRNLFFEVFFKYFPGVNSLRVPARFSSLALLGVALLAGEAIGWLQSALRRGGSAVAMLLIALICLESVSAPIGLEPAPCKPGEWPGVYQWLVSEAPPGPIMEIPFTGNWNDPKYVFYSIYHRRPMVNGYSSYFPPLFEPFRDTAPRLLDTDHIGLLEQLGVRLLVIHTDLLPIEERTPVSDCIAGTDTNRMAVIWSDATTRVLELRQALPPDVWPRQLTGKGLHCVLDAPSVAGTDADGLNARLTVTSPWSDVIIRCLTVPMNRTLDYVVTRDSNVVLRKNVYVGAACGGTGAVFELSLPAGLAPGDYVIQLSSGGETVASRQLAIREAVRTAGEGAELKAQVTTDRAAMTGPPGMEFCINILLKNEANALWVARRERHETKLGWKLRQGGTILKEGRVRLPYDVGPGDQVELMLPLSLPEVAGDYQLELCPVVENIAWFDSTSSTSVILHVSETVPVGP